MAEEVDASLASKAVLRLDKKPANLKLREIE